MDLTDFDPYDNNGVIDEDTSQVTNSRIIYITLAAIIIILLIWVSISFFSKHDITAILDEMQNIDTNLNPVSDLQT